MILPKLAVTIGDPAGIGPEITVKALSSKSIYEVCRPIVIGDLRFIPDYKKISKKFPCRFIDLPLKDSEKIVQGRFSRVTGKASYEYILKAVELINEGLADGLVTAPVSKEALFLAGVRSPGQTELLAELSVTKNFAMLMVAGSLRVAMVTRHIPLADVAKNLTIDSIKNTVLIAQKFIIEKYNIKEPKIIICSLNPHGGEGGILGKEERQCIAPAIRMLKDAGLKVSGPFGGDSAWLKTAKNEYDLMIAMYHDQAMIGLKCLDPQKIVNLTIGLPFIRTSPGHGTGFDIAGKNLADPTSMKEAIKLAAKLSQNAARI